MYPHNNPGHGHPDSLDKPKEELPKQENSALEKADREAYGLEAHKALQIAAEVASQGANGLVINQDGIAKLDADMDDLYRHHYEQSSAHMFESNHGSGVSSQLGHAAEVEKSDHTNKETNVAGADGSHTQEHMDDREAFNNPLYTSSQIGYSARLDSGGSMDALLVMIENRHHERAGFEDEEMIKLKLAQGIARKLA